MALPVLGLLAMPIAGENTAVSETTVEEARLTRLAETDIPHQALTEGLGPLPAVTDGVVLTEFGTRLWRQAVRAVQSEAVWDDRALYWARLRYAQALRQVADRDVLARFERASRGMNHVAFLPGADAPAGPGSKRVIVTGFDPFHLDQRIDQSNPSGLAALALDGRTFSTASGPAHVEAVVFPVRFADFDEGLVETFIEPWLEAGVDLVLTISMGRDGFDLERFPGRRRSADVPDNLNVLTGASAGQPLVPRLGAAELAGPEFLEFTLPAAAMAAVTGRFAVRDNRTVATLQRGELQAPDLASLAGQTAVRGSGGGYLSNEIAYRTLLVNQQRPRQQWVPMGHIHTPRLEGFDPEFERQVVGQIEALLVSAVEALPER